MAIARHKSLWLGRLEMLLRWVCSKIAIWVLRKRPVFQECHVLLVSSEPTNVYLEWINPKTVNLNQSSFYGVSTLRRTLLKERMWFRLLELSFEEESFGVLLTVLAVHLGNVCWELNHLVDGLRRAFPFPVLPGSQRQAALLAEGQFWKITSSYIKCPSSF